MMDVPDVVLLGVVGHAASELQELVSAAAVQRAWRAAAFSEELRSLRQGLARKLCLPSSLQRYPEVPRGLQPGALDWLEFTGRQVQLQTALAGTYGGALHPENLPPETPPSSFDWEQEHYVSASISPVSVVHNRCGLLSQRTYADEELLEEQSGDYEWLVLDRRRIMDRAILEFVQQFLPGGSVGHPPEHWEDGDLFCGVRAPHDFRPAIDPSFLDVTPLVVVLAPTRGPHCIDALTPSPSPPRSVTATDLNEMLNNSATTLGEIFGERLEGAVGAVLHVQRVAEVVAGWKNFHAWPVRLFAPCAWMFPKHAGGQARQAEKLDLWTSFRGDQVVCALVLGRQLEKPIMYDAIEVLLDACQPLQAEAAAHTAGLAQASASASSGGGGGGSSRRKGGRKSKLAKGSEPRDFRSGKNPRGLNLFVPRPRTASGSSGGAARGRTRSGSDGSDQPVRVPPRRSVLSWSAADNDLRAILRSHPPTLREAEQLCICGPEASATAEGDFDGAGLLQDAARLETCGALSHASVIDLARKWQCLGGKWLLFVPEWRVDHLFELAALKLREGAFVGASRLIVSPPGSYGTDTDKYMLSVHCDDFTNQREVMGIGKVLRAAARQGIRAPSGTWGELRDDPFAAPEKKVMLVFKPEVFTVLTLHRNNPYGIKTTLYTIDL
mmetsp:Transcript_127247/g.245422  ORF Transcript_127247/g.245422 Transcript_127247/m.245422 type:complete len:667 (-) Transcript_127247:94-2094(-)